MATRLVDLLRPEPLKRPLPPASNTDEIARQACRRCGARGVALSWSDICGPCGAR